MIHADLWKIQTCFETLKQMQLLNFTNLIDTLTQLFDSKSNQITMTTSNYLTQLFDSSILTQLFDSNLNWIQISSIEHS